MEATSRALLSTNGGCVGVGVVVAPGTTELHIIDEIKSSKVTNKSGFFLDRLPIYSSRTNGFVIEITNPNPQPSGCSE